MDVNLDVLAPGPWFKADKCLPIFYLHLPLYSCYSWCAVVSESPHISLFPREELTK